MCNSRLPQGFVTIWLRRHPLAPIACSHKCFLSDDLSGDDIVHPKEKKHRSGAHNYHSRILFYSRWWTVFASLPLGSEDCSTDTCNILLTMRTPLSYLQSSLLQKHKRNETLLSSRVSGMGRMIVTYNRLSTIEPY